MKRSGNGTSFTSERSDSGNNNKSRSCKDGLYDLLELSRNATPEAIKRTYRQLALLWHPDKGGNVTRFQSLTAAWEILGNPERRNAYDKQLKRLGSNDGSLFKRSSCEGTSKATKSGKTSIPGAGVDGATVATPETTTTRADKQASEWCLFRKRRHSTGELFTQHHEGKKETDSFKAWEKEQDTSTSGRTAVAAAKTWKSNNNPASVFRSEDPTGAPNATAQQSSITTTETSERVKESRSEAGSATFLSSSEGNSQQHAEKETANYHLKSGWNVHSSSNETPELPKGCIEEILNPSKHYDPVIQKESSPYAPSIYRSSSENSNSLFNRSDLRSPSAVTSTPGHRTFSRDFHHSSSSPLPAAGCKTASANAATAVNEPQCATDIFVPTSENGPSAATDDFISHTSSNWTAGSGSTESLERLEASLKEVLGEKGCFNRIPSTTDSIYEQVQRLGVKQLKQLLSILSIPHSYCIEKDDLLYAFTEAFPDVIVTRHGTAGELNTSEARGTHGRSNSINRSSTTSKLSTKSAEDIIDDFKGICGYTRGAEEFNGDARSDSKNSISSSESGIFHKFHTPGAAAHGAFAKSDRNAASLAAAAIARRKSSRRRRLFSPNPSSSAENSAAPPSSNAFSSSAVTVSPLSFTGFQQSCPAFTSTQSSNKRAEETSFHGVSSESVRHTLAAPSSLYSEDIRIKLIAIGGEKTGKSCIIKRYCEGRFIARNASTVALDYGVKVVKVKPRQNEALNSRDEEKRLFDAKSPPGTEMLIQVRVNFFDFSGKPEFRDVRKDFYAYTDGVMLVYDVSRRQTFLDLKHWIVEAASLLDQHHNVSQELTAKQSVRTSLIKKEFPETIQAQAPIVLLLGNKVDKEREVETAEGEAFAREHEMLFFETSANSGQHITEALETLFEGAAARVMYIRELLLARVREFESPESRTNCSVAAAKNKEEFNSAKQVSLI